MSLRTALVLVLQHPPLEEVRARFDPVGTAAGIPLHVTLLFPFHAPEAVDEAALEALFAGWSPLRFALARVEEFPGVLWLAPEPDREVRARMSEVYARFPETPPYGGGFPEPIPHATVGQVAIGGSQEELSAAVRAAAEPHLPAEFELGEASLLVEVAPDRWREARRFPLRAAA